MASRTIRSLGVLLARLAWLLLGPLGLLLLAFAIASAGGGERTFADLAFFGVLAIMLAGRWWEYRSGQGETAAGDPMTARDQRGYLVRAAVLGLGLWGAANLIGSYGPGR